jgi:hypothetical protein
MFKELLTTFFSDFVETFLPDVAAYLDLDSVVFLDKQIGICGYVSSLERGGTVALR